MANSSVSVRIENYTTRKLVVVREPVGNTPAALKLNGTWTTEPADIPPGKVVTSVLGGTNLSVGGLAYCDGEKPEELLVVMVDNLAEVSLDAHGDCFCGLSGVNVIEKQPSSGHADVSYTITLYDA